MQNRIIPFDPKKAVVGKVYQNRAGDQLYAYLGNHEGHLYFVNKFDLVPIRRHMDGSYNGSCATTNDIVMEVPEEPTYRSGPDLFPPGTVVSMLPEEGLWLNIRWVQKDSVGTSGDIILCYDALAKPECKLQRSIDGGKTWLPCYVKE